MKKILILCIFFSMSFIKFSFGSEISENHLTKADCYFYDQTACILNSELPKQTIFVSYPNLTFCKIKLLSTNPMTNLNDIIRLAENLKIKNGLKLKVVGEVIEINFQNSQLKLGFKFDLETLNGHSIHQLVKNIFETEDDKTPFLIAIPVPCQEKRDLNS